MNKIKTLSGRRLFLPCLCLALVLLFALLTNPSFFEIGINNGVLYGRLVDVLNRGSEVAILAVGMTLVASSSGGTDISVGAVMALSGAVCCRLLSGGAASTDTYLFPVALAMLAGILAGVLCGAWNGFLVANLKIQPMIATLILYSAGRAMAFLTAGSQIIYVNVPSFKYLGNFWGSNPIPTSILIAAVIVAIATLFLKKTSLGLYIQSVGINAKASRLVGLKSVKIVFLTYVISGLCAGIAGIVATSRIYSADTNNIGLNYELDAILAVALGGNSLGGGKFSLMGSIIGAYTIQCLSTLLLTMRVSATQIPVYKAVVVILIVVIQSPETLRLIRQISGKMKKQEGTV